MAESLNSNYVSLLIWIASLQHWTNFVPSHPCYTESKARRGHKDTLLSFFTNFQAGSPFFQPGLNPGGKSLPHFVVFRIICSRAFYHDVTPYHEENSVSSGCSISRIVLDLLQGKTVCNKLYVQDYKFSCTQLETHDSRTHTSDFWEYLSGCRNRCRLRYFSVSSCRLISKVSSTPITSNKLRSVTGGWTTPQTQKYLSLLSSTQRPHFQQGTPNLSLNTKDNKMMKIKRNEYTSNVTNSK